MILTLTSHSLESLLSYEYLETNGIGGWSGSTVTGVNTRRYHGILVAATKIPVERMVLLSRLDETVVVNGARIECATREFPGAFHPEGYRSLTKFRRELYPEWEIDAGGIVIRKRLLALHGENTVAIAYSVESGEGEVTLELRPFFAYRDYHSLARANEYARRDIQMSAQRASYQMYDGTPPLHFIASGLEYSASPDWYYRFYYRIEEERGLEASEDLFTPGVLRLTARRGRELIVGVSTAVQSPEVIAIKLREELRRREILCERFANGPSAKQRLALAADQFIVRRALPSGEDGKTVIAGYHWFTDWGRDTMIALPGLCLETGRSGEAREILDQFAAYVSEGMVPNRFPDGAEGPEYNTVDASLWFFVAVLRYIEATGDLDPLRERWLPKLEEILQRYREGTRFGIRADEDGLLLAGDATTQLTWMDAKVGDWVVTPRYGKTVEINALWVNAHFILARCRSALAERCRSALGDEDAAKELTARAEQLKRIYADAFWDEERGILVDCIRDGIPDRDMRPNQLYAMSLPFPLLERERAIRLLAAVKEELLTPVGIRSLSPCSNEYRGVYRGGIMERDGAYHQGTVWSFLIGAYVEGLLRTKGSAARDEARAAVQGLLEHLDAGCIGSIAEIFDGDSPHAPRGCVAQAWGVAELLRSLRLIEEA